jgi:hypothetical protein
VNPLLRSLEDNFLEIHRRSIVLIDRTPDDLLYRQPRDPAREFAVFTIGENLLRSAAAVEQVAGGITTRLWDDPFEWTLPEKLSSGALVRGYLDEVEDARLRAFKAIAADNELSRQIPSPQRVHTLLSILVDAAIRASHFQGRAYTIYQAVSGEKPPAMRSID